MNKSVLLVDDDPNLLLLLSDYLQYKGLECSTAESINEGLELYTKSNPDLVISGIAMQTRKCGYRFLQQIRDHNIEQPFIYLSAQLSDPVSKRYASRLGVDACVAKPFEPDELLEEVHRALQV